MDYFIHLFILILIYAGLAISLNLLVGETGLLSLAHASFFGIGAYAMAIMGTALNTHFLINVIIGILLAIALSYVISRATLKLHDDYFAIATFSFQLVLYAVLKNWEILTKGPIGIAGIPKPVIAGWNIDNNYEFMVCFGIFLLCTLLFVYLLKASRFGVVLKAISEDEIFVKA